MVQIEGKTSKVVVVSNFCRKGAPVFRVFFLFLVFVVLVFLVFADFSQKWHENVENAM